MTLPTNAGEQELPSEKEQQEQVRQALGACLRQAREARDITLEKASGQLRIHKAYLQGLEDGDWSNLPEDVYVMGFLRQYAALLGAKIDRYIEDLKPNEYKLTKPFTIPDPPIAMNRGWAFAAGACFLLLFILFNVVDDTEENRPPQNQTLSSRQPSLPAQDHQATNSTAAPAAQPKAMTETRHPPIKERNAVTQPSGDTASVASSPISEQDSPKQQSSPGKQTLIPVGNTNGNEGRTSKHPTAVAADKMQNLQMHDYRLSAVGENVWLQLRNPQGELFREALLRQGQTLKIQAAEPELLLTCGNPVALRIEIDGALQFAPGSLGEKGKVLRRFHLRAPKPSAISR